MMLPNTAKTFLYSQRVGELTYLLKLINTYYKANALFLGNTFRKIQDFLRRIILRRYPQ